MRRQKRGEKREKINLFDIQIKFIPVKMKKREKMGSKFFIKKRLCNEKFDSFALEADGDDSVSLGSATRTQTKLYISYLS